MAGIRLTVLGTPVPQGSMTCVGGGPGRPHNVQPSNKSELYAWRNRIAAAAAKARETIPGAGWVSHDPVRIALTFTVERPKSVTRDWPSVPPDLDKMLRAIFDGITKGELWNDDGQVVWIDPTVICYPDRAELAPRPEDVLEVPGVVIRLSDPPSNRLI